MWFRPDAHRRARRLMWLRGNLRICSWWPVWFRRGCSRLLLVAALSLTGTAPAAAIEVYEQILTRDQWPQYANGQNILVLPAVHQTLRRFAENDRITIVIRYPGGDPGRQWATELYGWLVSFGVPTRYLELEPGAGAAGRLVVSVIDRR